MDYTDEIYSKLVRKGLDEVVVEQSDSQVHQIRFSESTKDLFNTWGESTISVFASSGKRVANAAIKDYSRIDELVEEIAGLCSKVPENPEFMGINHEKASLGAQEVTPLDSEKVMEYARSMIDGSVEFGSERSAGVVYSRFSRIHLRSGYNDLVYDRGGTELVIRSFIGEYSGQESFHFGPGLSLPAVDPGEMGRSAAETARKGRDVRQGDEGKLTVLMSPYVLGNILSCSGGFLSSHMARTGLSPFMNRLGEDVASENVTLVDDPTDRSGEGVRPVDDEGTPTRKNTLIKKGRLKTFLHSYSTAELNSTESTGNAGILFPVPWQLKLEKGTESMEDMLSEIKDGLFINNTWYTRFQDYRNGVFSTVPRDGVFRIKDGRIQESWSGIRISDSVLNILGNVSKVSRETKNTKWWLEIEPSIMPYALVENVNITRSF
ncbi:hypothetical protein IX51_02895 [uncultured archaeon]|nr:hypothetical protein IX51_02895 [uncultured archaeon]